MAYNPYSTAFNPNESSTNSSVQTSPYTKSPNPVSYTNPRVGISDPGQGSNKTGTSPAPTTVHYHYYGETPKQPDAAGNDTPPSDPNIPQWPTNGGYTGGITGGGAVGQYGFPRPRPGSPYYEPPPTQPLGPMVTPNGGVPPGLPYNPVQPSSGNAFGVSPPNLTPSTPLPYQPNQNLPAGFQSLAGGDPQAGYQPMAPLPGDTTTPEPLPPATPPPVSTPPPPPAATAPPPAAANPSNPASFTMPQFNQNDPAQLKQAIESGLMAAYGRVDPSQVAYYMSKWPELSARGAQLGDPQYAWNRLIGMGAGGADAATAGPYAGGTPPGPAAFFQPNSGIMNQQYALISQLMSGGPITPEVIAMMNAQNQATSAQAGKDALRQFNQNAAGRGVFQGGSAEAVRQRLMDNAMRAQLQGQREVGIQAPQTNYSALINALTSGQGVIGANNQLGYAYNNANASLEQQFANWLANIQG